MLSDNTTSRSIRLVASKAKATRRQGQPSRIQANNGVKQVETSSSRRCFPDLRAAGLYQSRSRCRTVFQHRPIRGLKALATAVSAQERANTMPKLHRAKTTA